MQQKYQHNNLTPGADAYHQRMIGDDDTFLCFYPAHYIDFSTSIRLNKAYTNSAQLNLTKISWLGFVMKNRNMQ